MSYQKVYLLTSLMDPICTVLILLLYWRGLLLGAGLIIAIGAQNAFVLKQCILQNHVLTAVLISSVIDAIMISLGVGGFGQILTSNNFFLDLARWGGAAFLVYYGLRSLRAVFKTESLKVSKGRSILNLKKTVTTALALSLYVGYCDDVDFGHVK